MSKQVLPTYAINTLKDSAIGRKDFVADHFAHYLDEHRNLRFPHKHSFYHLVYFTNGSGGHSIDFINFQVLPGQIYFMVPGQVHSWNFDGPVEGYIVNFSEQYMQELIANPRYLDQFSFFSGVANEQVRMIPGEGMQQVEIILETVVREGNSGEELKDDFVRCALLQLFILVARFSGKEQHSELNHYNLVLLRNFQKLIEQYYKEKKLTKDYAAMLYVTPNHLNGVSKDVTGRSAGELIRDRIILEAKRLLVNAKLTVGQVALELDFTDNSYFSKFFRKYTGTTPETFRNQIIQK